jgi:hypothetical protein
MTALSALAVFALGPWIAFRALRVCLGVGRTGSPASEERALLRFHRIVLRTGMVVPPISAIVGALLVDPALATRWPTAGAWVFASLCGTTSWASLAIGQRGPEERSAMPALELVGRVVQMSTVPALGVGLSLVAFSAAESLVPMIPTARSVVAAFLSFAATIVVSPWLAIRLGLWRRLPLAIDADGVEWQVAHFPATAPFLTHAAALPWLRTVLVTDGLFRRAPASHWRALVEYEIGGGGEARRGRVARWAIAVPLSLVVFIAANAVGAGDPHKLVAATALAVIFSAAAAWIANREPPSPLKLDAAGPSMQELAQTLRSLPPSYGQALPRTSHRPLGTALYDRLLSLGHDPGPRPHT